MDIRGSFPGGKAVRV